ncbi:MAG TPA: hypothetical protein VM187_01120, partial [Niastella sp.]|nr:hypothetical protein [Niastella sp.]
MTILLLVASFALRPVISLGNTIQFDFCGELISFDFDEALVPNTPILSTEASISAFYHGLNSKNYEPVITALREYKEKFKPDDWLFYQLIRKTAQQISPKDNDYHGYTLYKWYFLSRLGYDARLAVSGDYILLYIYCDENTY